MGSSTIKLVSAFDYVAARGVPDPRAGAGGYGVQLALRLGQQVMNDLIAERFNWKWNRAIAAAFLTNSYQQDYPQIGLQALGWLETCAVVDINNTQVPPPLGTATVRRDLARAGMTLGYGPGGVRNQQVSWDYNRNLQFGKWPGPGVTFSPLITAQVVQNPIMSMVDANGNLLIVTTFGTTANVPPTNVAPLLPPNTAEGTTVVDGTVVWTVVSPNSQGFRVFPLPGPTGPVYQFTPIYQQKAPTLLNLSTSTLDPIPDDYSNVFFTGVEWQCKGASPNPAERKEFKDNYPLWLKSLEDARKQGDREADAYGMLPASSPVDNVYGWLRNPQDPSQPY